VVIGNLLQLSVGLVVLAFAFAGLLKFLPDAHVRWRDALVGGVVAAVLFSAGKKLFALYLAHAGITSSFGAAGSLAVLLMWLYFSAAVLLLGAEFSAARGRMHDPRGGWGMQDNTPPGSRAKLASVLAASTVSADDAAPRTGEAAAADGAARTVRTSSAGALAGASAGSGLRVRPRKQGSAGVTTAAAKLSRSVALAEEQAIRVAAGALLEAGR
jgi:membrane protein